MIVNTHVIHLKIQTAVVNSTIETINAPTSGYISAIYVNQGMIVKKGSPLFKIVNFDLLKDLELAKLNLEDAKLNRNYYEKLLGFEKEKNAAYQRIGMKRLSSAQALSTVTKQDVIYTKSKLSKMKELYSQNYITKLDWEKYLADYQKALSNNHNMLAMKDIENESLYSLKKGLYFTGNKLEGTSGELIVQIEIANERIKLFEKKINVYENIIDQLTVRAPADGKIIDILRLLGSNIDNSKPIMLLENTHTNKKIIAFLTQNEASEVNMQKPINIFIPALNEMYKGKILSLDRTTSYIDEMKVQYKWHDTNDRTAIVTISINKNDESHFNQSISSGMPALVYFKRRLNLF